MYYALSAAILLLLAWFVRNDAAEYGAFRALTDTADRQRVLRRWTSRSFLFFFVGAAGLLAMLGRIEAVRSVPVEFASLAAALARRLVREDHVLVYVMIAGFGGGMIGATVAAVLKTRRDPEARIAHAMLEPLLPRNRAERRIAVFLSVNAGVSEELFFRLLLPLVLALATGQALLAFAVACLAFGTVHFYQGWAGVLGATVAGVIFTFFYLATGTILVPMLLHMLADLNSLWLRPWLAERSAARRARVIA